MTEVHHQTRKAADIALAKRTISRASYDAILAGEISLQAARDLGREGGPTPADASVRPGTATETPPSAGDGAADAPPQPSLASARATARGFAYVVANGPRVGGSRPGTTSDFSSTPTSTCGANGS